MASTSVQSVAVPLAFDPLSSKGYKFEPHCELDRDAVMKSLGCVADDMPRVLRAVATAEAIISVTCYGKRFRRFDALVRDLYFEREDFKIYEDDSESDVSEYRYERVPVYTYEREVRVEKAPDKCEMNRLPVLNLEPCEVDESLIINHGVVGFSTVVEEIPEPVEPECSASVPLGPSMGPVGVQACVDSWLPTHSWRDDKWDQSFVEIGDFQIDISSVKLSSSFNDKLPPLSYDPVVQVDSLRRRDNSQRESLIAVKKRNRDVPVLGYTIDVNSVSDWVAQRFIESFIDASKLSSFHDAAGKALEYWKKFGKLLSEPSLLFETSCDKYDQKIKEDVKYVVEDVMHMERPVAATITYHGKNLTSQFSPLFTALFESFQFALKPNVLIPSGKVATLELKNFSVNGKHCLEIDLSKFDKSQGELHLEFQRKILKLLGMSCEFVDFWCDFHRWSRIKDPVAKVSYDVAFQRRTGDAFTFFGNTIVTMAEFCCCYDVSQFALSIFSGDDSLGLSDGPAVGNPDLFVELFNMEAKIAVPGVPYICSKFLVDNEKTRSVVSIPDPLREVQRFGKKKIPVNHSQMLDPREEHYQAMLDRMRFIGSLDYASIDQLRYWFSLKYHREGAWIDQFLSECRYYSSKSSNFRSLFPSPVVTDDPSGVTVESLSVPSLEFANWQQIKGRKVIYFGNHDGDYFHNNVLYRKLPMPIAVADLAKKLNVQINSCLVNYYDENLVIPWHSDDEKCYSDDPIYTLNYRGVGLFSVKNKRGNTGVKSWRLGSKENNLLVMPKGFQRTHSHSVRAESSGRISLTFRVYRNLMMYKDPKR